MPPNEPAVGLSYLQTLSGKLKFVEIGLNIIASCLIGLAVYGGIVSFFLSATIIGSILSTAILVLHIFKLLRKNESQKEFFALAFISLYLLCPIILMIRSEVHNADAGIYAQIIFGVILVIASFITYIVDTGLTFMEDPLCFRR